MELRTFLSYSQESDRSKLFEGLQDPETSAQGINPATIQNPLANQLLYQNQAGLGGAGGLYNNPAAFASLGGGGLANLGGGVFGNQLGGQFGGVGSQLGGYSGLGGAGGFGGINPYLSGAGGIGGFQNPYAFGGLNGGGVDIYNQGALAAQLYNNPYGGSGTLAGAAAGINPLLLRGAQNTQYPVIGGLGNYNPYLAAQALLSPYSNYNQLNNYPFSSRFGIGAGSSGRSGLGSRSSSNNNNNNNDE